MRRLLGALLGVLVLTFVGSGVAYAQDGETGVSGNTITVNGVSVNFCNVGNLNSGNLDLYLDSLVKALNDRVDGDPEIEKSTVANLLSGVGLGTLPAIQARCAPPSSSATPAPTPSPNRPFFLSCAEYHARGIFDIPRTDPRYRAALDRDRDGVACERDERDLRFDPRRDHRSCTDLRRDQDRARLELVNARTNLNRVVSDARKEESPGGRELTAEEREDIRVAARAVDEKQRVFDRIVDDRREACRDNGGDTHIHVTVTPLPPEVTSSAAPSSAPSASSSSSSSGEQVSRVPVGGAETGDGSTDVDGYLTAVGVGGLALLLASAATVLVMVRRWSPRD